jgi:hypothetical protein
MKYFWTMGFERLNGIIKRPSHIMNNFRNPQVHNKIFFFIVIKMPRKCLECNWLI